MHRSIAEGIDWVGFVDWTTRDFHGYRTERGTTYNAYLIRDKENALIDTVKAPFADHLIENISELIEPRKVNFIICNHAEPDHSGALPALVEACPQAEIVCNQKCREILARHYNTAYWSFRVVSDGHGLSLGQRSLLFLDTPMAHWPESMATYLPREQIVFSMDNFGQHFASSGRFDGEEPFDVLMAEAKSYYANILMPYASMVGRTLERVKSLNPRIIAPSHGVAWRDAIPSIFSAYGDWVAGKRSQKALVVYDNMWGGTEEMARAICEGAAMENVEAKLLHVRTVSSAELASEALDAGGIAFGSPTLNRTMMPQMAAALTYLKGLRPTNKAGFVFGCYGWSRGAEAEMQSYLKDMRFDIVRDPLLSQYAPDSHNLEECRKAGSLLAQVVMQRAEQETAPVG